jgi:3-oxoacyl-(acyl-carrier-protein) synthase
MPIATYGRLGWLAPDVESATPFVAAHRGWALTNAAAMVVLEDELHARARGATLLGALDLAPASLDTNTLVALDRTRAERPDLFLWSGTRGHVEDADALRIAGAVPSLSLDGVTGYAGAASPVLTLAAACRLLANPRLYRDGTWLHHHRVAVLNACGDGSEPSWGAVQVEAIS